MFGRTVELRRAIHRTAVRVGFVTAVAVMALLCALVVIMETMLPGGHLDSSAARILVPVFGLLAIASAAITVFAPPLVFRRMNKLVRSIRASVDMFIDASQSNNAYERAAARLGVLAIAQMIAAAIPTFLGFVAFVTGARVSVFAVFVALSVVILAAVCPRASEWDDSIDRLVADEASSDGVVEDSVA